MPALTIVHCGERLRARSEVKMCQRVLDMSNAYVARSTLTHVPLSLSAWPHAEPAVPASGIQFANGYHVVVRFSSNICVAT
jgi:hypothetical protein